MEADREIFAIRSAQNGDQRAWCILFKWHFEPVYKYCLNLSSGRQDMAEEITQQVFMTAARRIGRFKPKIRKLPGLAPRRSQKPLYENPVERIQAKMP